MSFKGFKDKELKANEYVKFLTDLDKTRLNVEDQINQSADIQNTRVRAREAINANVIKALGRTEEDYQKLEKRLEEEQLLAKDIDAIKGTNAEIVDFFVNYRPDLLLEQDDGTGYQLIQDPTDPNNVIIGEGYVIAFDPKYENYAIPSIPGKNGPLTKGTILLLMFGYDTLKSLGAFKLISKDDAKEYMSILTETNPTKTPLLENDKIRKIKDIIGRKKAIGKIYRSATSANPYANLKNSLYDPTDVTQVRNIESFKGDRNAIRALFNVDIPFDEVIEKIMIIPEFFTLNQDFFKNGKLCIRLDPVIVKGIVNLSFKWKIGEAENNILLSHNKFGKSGGAAATVTKSKTLSTQAGSAYIYFDKSKKETGLIRFISGGPVPSKDTKGPNTLKMSPNDRLFNLLFLFSLEGIQFLYSCIAHDNALLIEERTRAITGDPKNLSVPNWENDRKRALKENDRLEKLVIQYVTDASDASTKAGEKVAILERWNNLMDTKAYPAGSGVAEGGRMMSPEQFVQLQAMKKVEASNPVSFTEGGMIATKPAGKPKGRKPSNGLYMMKDGKFGGLTIDMPHLFNNMKIKAMKGGAIAFESPADKDTIDLLTKRYDSRRAYSGLAQKNIAKLIQLSELPPAENSAKLKMTQRYITAKRARKGLKGGKIPELDELIAMCGSLNAGNTPNKKLQSQIFDLAAKLVKSGDLDMETYKQIINNYA